MSARFVVTATGTGIGKTVFAAALTHALRGRYWKPIQAGLDDETDSETVMRLAALPDADIVPEAYRLARPMSPHRAAELEGVTIEFDRLQPPDAPGALVIEGAGGVLVPIDRQTVFADLFARWQLPVILVTGTMLGTISHSLTAIEALRARGVPLHGLAFIGDANDDSESTIAAMSGVRRLGRLPWIDPLDSATLNAAFASAFALGDFA